jgi:hypothetical protein
MSGERAAQRRAEQVPSGVPHPSSDAFRLLRERGGATDAINDFCELWFWRAFPTATDDAGHATVERVGHRRARVRAAATGVTARPRGGTACTTRTGTGL